MVCVTGSGLFCITCNEMNKQNGMGWFHRVIRWIDVMFDGQEEPDVDAVQWNEQMLEKSSPTYPQPFKSKPKQAQCPFLPVLEYDSTPCELKRTGAGWYLKLNPTRRGRGPVERIVCYNQIKQDKWNNGRVVLFDSNARNTLLPPLLLSLS